MTLQTAGKEDGAVLLTGATGFLGSHLLKALLASGRRVIVLKRSFSDTVRIKDCLASVPFYDLDKMDCGKVFAENRVDIIIHCATDYGRGARNPHAIIDANLILPLDLLYAGQQHGLKAFINTDTILDKRINYYSLSKSHFTDWMKMCASRMKCITLSLEHFYGAGDNRTKFVTHVITSLLENVPSLDITKGEQKRDFIYIDDVARAFMTVLDNLDSLSCGYTKFEVGSGSNIAIRDFVELLRDISGNTSTKLNFGALPYRENEVMESHVDISGITALGWRPVMPLKQGLNLTVEQQRRSLK
jgi:nucleoside-diphosphate-sugar epimerase